MDVVTYYTTGGPSRYYFDRSVEWVQRMYRLGVGRYHAVPLLCSGDWGTNTRRKPLVIASMRCGPILWLDVDDTYSSLPEIPGGCDIAGVESPHHDRVIASGAVYLNNTPGAGEVLRRWVAYSMDPSHVDKSDEWALNMAIRDVSRSRELVVGLFPAGFRTLNESRERGRYWEGGSVERGARLDP